jgi:hypothetical protein
VYTNKLRFDQSRRTGQKVKELYGTEHTDLQDRDRLFCRNAGTPVPIHMALDPRLYTLPD